MRTDFSHWADIGVSLRYVSLTMTSYQILLAGPFKQDFKA